MTVSNEVQQEIHYIQLEDEEDLAAYHDDEWDYETELDLQLDYSGRNMIGDYEEITFEVYEQHRHIAHGDAEIIDLEQAPRWSADAAAAATAARDEQSIMARARAEAALEMQQLNAAGGVAEPEAEPEPEEQVCTEPEHESPSD